MRYCIYCGTPTLWRRVPDGVVTPPKSPVHVAEGAVAVHSPPVNSGAMARTQALASARVPRPAETKRLAQGGRTRLAGAELLVSDSLPELELPPAASAVVAKAANRRRDVRTRVNFSACVRFGESEEIVECANLSRRGFGFRSRKQYPIGGQILVAVPFYVGTPPSFVTGSVRHVTALPNHNYQYGVMYASGAARDPQEVKHNH